MRLMTTKGNFLSLGERIATTAERIAGLRAELEDECETRDRQILEAIDSGCTQGEVARWSGITKTRVRQVIAEQAAVA
jgi:hypothetical protein